jgi:NAD(P)-dependent dehydrogenase (short-subunit alcohol dehydrogenase family)
MGKRSCVVTGASGGIGEGIVRELLNKGWSVVGLDIQEPRESEETYPSSVTYLSVLGDVAVPAAHEESAALAQSLAPLEGWVNCAGYNILGSVAELEVEKLRRGIDVDLLGVFFGTAEASRHFLKVPIENRSGSIVNISSIQASVGFPGFAAYAMAKGGIESLSRQVAAEYIREKIRCNTVAPGLIASPMNESLLSDAPDSEEQMWRWGQLTPMGRWGTAEDVASAVSFLLSEESSYITGQVLAVNGGALTIAPGQGNL